MVVRCTCLATLGTKLHHELGIGLTFIPTRPRGTHPSVILVVAGGFFGIKGELFSGRSYPITFFSWSTPLLGILSFAPTVEASGLFHGRAMHDQRSFVMCGWRSVPVRRNGVNHLSLVKIFLVPKFRIVMNKNGGIPGTNKLAWAAVKAFGRFVKENVTTRQNDLMGSFGAQALQKGKSSMASFRCSRYRLFFSHTYFLVNLQ
jgi:hypothetical protein